MGKKKRPQHKPYPDSKLVDFESAMEDYDPGELWSTQDGQTIAIKNLRNSHLENIVKYFNDHNRNAPSIILAEIRRRKQTKLLKSSKAGKILYGSKDR